MTEAQYLTFRHETLVLLGLRHWPALLGDGKGVTVLALLYTALRGDDGDQFLRHLDQEALVFARKELTCTKNAVRQLKCDDNEEAYNALRLDFIALVLRYKDLPFQCATRGLTTALYMSYCLGYETLLLPMFELEAQQLISMLSFGSVANWQLWLHQGLVCAWCFKTHSLSLCGVCRRVYYCSTHCQTFHRQRHRPQCKFDQ
jgi:hypothetical protein